MTAVAVGLAEVAVGVVAYWKHVTAVAVGLAEVAVGVVAYWKHVTAVAVGLAGVADCVVAHWKRVTAVSVGLADKHSLVISAASRHLQEAAVSLHCTGRYCNHDSGDDGRYAWLGLCVLGHVDHLLPEAFGVDLFSSLLA